MAIKISNTTVIDDSRNLVNTGISSVLVNSLTSTDTSKALTAAQGKALQDTTVKLTGNQTVAGVKTFSSSPVIPTPTAGNQAANKAYVDAAGVSASDILNATAGASAGAVGTYAWLYSSNRTLFSFGGTIAGSNLRVSGSSRSTDSSRVGGQYMANVGATTVSGTWRAVSRVAGLRDSGWTSEGLFLRIS